MTHIIYINIHNRVNRHAYTRTHGIILARTFQSYNLKPWRPFNTYTHRTTTAAEARMKVRFILVDFLHDLNVRCYFYLWIIHTILLLCSFGYVFRRNLTTQIIIIRFPAYLPSSFLLSFIGGYIGKYGNFEADVSVEGTFTVIQQMNPIMLYKKKWQKAKKKKKEAFRDVSKGFIMLIPTAAR